MQLFFYSSLLISLNLINASCPFEGLSHSSKRSTERSQEISKAYHLMLESSKIKSFKSDPRVREIIEKTHGIKVLYAILVTSICLTMARVIT